MAMACFCFGCKGAGQALRVASTAAVVATRVAAVAIAASQSSGEGEGEQPVEAPADPIPTPHGGCTELSPMPELPGDVVPVRTLDCGGRILVQDAETGMWRDHR
jgi:hypothetical protein